MLVLFLDGMGQGIVFPVYSKAIFDTHSLLLNATTSEATRNIWYGILVGVFYFCWFIGAAILSDLSDKSGRKRALVICLSGSAVGNILSALAFTFHNVWILLLGRIIVGFTNGSQPIAQASIVDTSPKEKLGRNLGLIVMSVSLGLVAGPLIGGFLSSDRYIAWFSNSTPLYFAGIMACVNIILLLIFYHETAGISEKIKIRLARALEIFVSAFRDKSVRFLSICFFLLQTSWAIYYVYISAFMVQRYSLSKTEVSLFFSLVAFGVTFGLAILAALFEKWKFDRKHVVLGGFGLVLLSLAVTSFLNQKIWAWLAAFPLGVGLGFGYAFILAIFSNQVAPEKQGWIMGITSALLALGTGLSSLIEAFLSPLGLELPFYVAMGFNIIGLMLFLGFRSRKEPELST